ncbi:septum site-determining protein MinC [Tepidimonas sp.]|uniref:septum site-determining protein MinC n=1 Tax=Tepidimonas sp. TaxID=2002775 RepID=UPI002FE0E544
MRTSAASITRIDIRHGQLPLVVARLRGSDIDALLRDLDHRYGDASGFFENEPLLLDFSDWAESEPASTALQQQALLQALRRAGLRPLAYQAAPVTWQPVLDAAGLLATESHGAHGMRLPAERTESPPPPPAPAMPQASASALVVDRPLRSGQQVYARGRDLVVLAMVNPGAEVIADGHVHVYAPLRGRAIAGARGQADARIFALALEAELVAIAGLYRTAETPWPDEVRGRPAQVRLQREGDGERLLFEPLV